MEKAIWIDYLRKEELLYELKFFKISVDDKMTRDVLRKRYRRLCSMSKEGNIKQTEYGVPEEDTEVRLCAEPISELVKLQNELTPDDDTAVKRIVARAQYYLMRLNRLTSPSQVTLDLKTKVVNIITLLTENSDDDMQSIRESSESEPEIEQKSKLVYVKEKSSNLCSLNLKYDGTTCVRIFIERLEELRIARGISEKSALIAFSDLLEKSALYWFRANKQLIDSYQHLLARLKEDFDIPDLDYKLIKEIRMRTQAKQESIVAYLSIMQGLFSRLSKPLSEQDKLDILMHNIRPEYMKEMALLDINTISDLQFYGKKLELARARADQFVEPSASHTKHSISCDQKKTYNTNSYPQNKNISVINAPPGSQVCKKCFRCNRTNHHTGQCRTSKEVVCFKCGEKGFKRTECPKCSKN